MNETRSPRCFLSTPLSPEFRYLRQLISSSLEEIGIEPVLIEETGEYPESTTVFAKRAIELADIVIADLTGDNPNVMYEVGFANALRKPVLPIVRNDSGRVPEAINGQLFLVYDPSMPAKLGDDIKIWVPRYLKKGSAESRAS